MSNLLDIFQLGITTKEGLFLSNEYLEFLFKISTLEDKLLAALFALLKETSKDIRLELFRRNMPKSKGTMLNQYCSGLVEDLYRVLWLNFNQIDIQNAKTCNQNCYPTSWKRKLSNTNATDFGSHFSESRRRNDFIQFLTITEVAWKESQQSSHICDPELPSPTTMIEYLTRYRDAISETDKGYKKLTKAIKYFEKLSAD